jgi:hypothetical protein
LPAAPALSISAVARGAPAQAVSAAPEQKPGVGLVRASPAQGVSVAPVPKPAAARFSLAPAQAVSAAPSRKPVAGQGPPVDYLHQRRN